MSTATLSHVEEAPATQSMPVASVLRRNLPSLSVAAGAFLLLFLPTLLDLVLEWAKDSDYSHGFLIPPICVALLVRQRQRLGALETGSSRIGFAVAVVSLVLFFAGHITFVSFLKRLGCFGTLIGSIWFVLGTNLVRAAPFPFLFLFLAIPPPSMLIGPLRLILKRLATRLSSETLFLLGINAFPEGNILVVDGHRLEVADACSGIRSLVVTVTVAVLFAHLLRTGFGKGLLLTLTAIPVTIVVNIFRILIVAVAISGLGVDLTTGVAHEILGFLVFGVSIALVYASWRFYEWFFRWRPRESAS